jgi:hypothetical protein
VVVNPKSLREIEGFFSIVPVQERHVGIDCFAREDNEIVTLRFIVLLVALRSYCPYGTRQDRLLPR